MEERRSVGKPIRCRAAVARKAGEPLSIEEVIVAPPKSGEVRLRVICSSLCQTDVAFWKMKDPPGYFPRIFGHESFGVVESIGENVNEVAVGDTVVPIFLADCGECIDCRSTKSNLCTKFPFQLVPWMHRDQGSRFTDLNGEILHHFLSISSFSEYTVVDIAHITKVNPEVPPQRACLLSCGISAGVGAALKTANVEAGSTVAIFGLGTIGLAVSEGARLCGAKRIIGVDLNEDKFEIGKRFGITDFINSRTCDKSISQGWGKIVVLGVDKPESQVSLSAVDIPQHGKTLTGRLFGGLKPKSDIPMLVQRYMNKELELDKFVTGEIGLTDINKAFDLLVEGNGLRCVIWMDK